MARQSRVDVKSREIVILFIVRKYFGRDFPSFLKTKNKENCMRYQSSKRLHRRVKLFLSTSELKIPRFEFVSATVGGRD